ncbi:MAG: hypothetical protein G01um101425_67 [Candidatus Peregrinibacteria bacterium Gr01-1014_25]|nr:MAG: hypothetical protein G01um101425_67 [Candidatus Peregrinibacteria bacterium Gr01-1014_25]
MTNRVLRLWLAILYGGGVLTHLIQPLRGMLDPAYRGLIPYNGPEEAMYLLRTQEALLHPWNGIVSNGVWSGIGAPPGMQMAGGEHLIGLFLGWTGIAAPYVVLALTALIAPLILVLTSLLARRWGLPPVWALASGVLVFWLVAFGHRFFHPGFSLPLVLAALIALSTWWDRPGRHSSVLAGALLGAGVHLYFWSWTFLWVTAGLLALACIADRRLPQRPGLLRSLPLLGGVTVLVALPAIAQMVEARAHPAYTETAVRVGLVASRGLESPVRSLLTALFALALLWSMRHAWRRYGVLLASSVALAIVYSQQLIHGLVISFSSHYYQYVCVIALLGAFVALRVRPRAVSTWVAVGIAGLFIAGGVHDYGKRIDHFMRPETSHQHLASALDALRDGTVDTVLADRWTADLVASYTEDDVVFTEYTELLLIADDDYRQRYCLSEMYAPRPLPVDDLVVFAEARLRVVRGQEAQEEYDASVAAVRDVCERIRRDPKDALQRVGVTKLLWDEKRRPAWKPDGNVFVKVSQGDGWSLWGIR